MTDCFNPEPIMLRNPTSLLAAEDQIKQDQIIEIAQHLAPEQFQYEFPPKSRIMEIEAEIINEDDQFSYFDECSFTTTSTSTAAYSNIIYEEDEEEQDDEDYYHQLMNNSARSSSDRLDRYFESFTNEHGNAFLADNQLSPLQLPTQMPYSLRHIREESYDSTGTVVIRKASQYSSPSSFLSESSHHHLACVAEEDRIHWDENSFIFPDQSSHFVHENVHRSIHPYRMESEADIFDILNEDDNISNFSTNSKVIVMKISKTHPPRVIQYTNSSLISTTDEGYDDEEYDECKELPIESASVFLPLSDCEQEQLMDLEALRQLAAIKIQSCWRGYSGRKQQQKSNMKLSNRVMAGLARVNDSIHRRNHNQLQDRCYELEQRLGEETAMRIAFEKAMEDMTIVMDHQHKVLNERVEQEVDMRQAYERKMEQVIGQVQPLESRLRHESKARADMESMMSRVLDQLHDIKVQQKEEVEQRKSMQRKLDDATKEIALLKKQPSTVTVTASRVRPATATSTRPSVVPNTTTRPATSTAQRPLPKLSSTGRNASPVPVKRTHTPISSRPTTTRPTTVSRLSTRPTTTTTTVEKKTTTATPLRKTVINRKI
ncbi:hypothetical protein HPULCUR_007171 [Helicostylum pulchrum]|uniref:Uncharacterized protein n=1 Tax=Helicostylum pulchrum TaxID=562976 RepID=A0ABP9Y406_9FUNG